MKQDTSTGSKESKTIKPLVSASNPKIVEVMRSKTKKRCLLIFAKYSMNKFSNVEKTKLIFDSMVNEFLSAIMEDRELWQNAKTAANWTCVGICAR